METVENVDVEVTFADGSRWGATVLSLAEIGRIMDRWEATGEGLGGSYFQCPDMIIVRCGGVVAIAEMLNGLVDSGEFRSVLARIDIEE
ncbi:hypothetical protein [Actinophytocola sp.]|uniref:hypothetical protein n=1 Tax=Actinophytocola sp. TaxID=1872138 RepID=UPI002DB739F7|nr:hypothetical protein [Actinophytocola sp.]